MKNELKTLLNEYADEVAAYNTSLGDEPELGSLAIVSFHDFILWLNKGEVQVEQPPEIEEQPAEEE